MIVTEVHLGETAPEATHLQQSLVLSPSPSWRSRLIVLLTLLSCWGCSDPPQTAESENAKPRVFLDRKSKEYFVGIKQDSGIPVNPETGKPTLSETLYCPQCQQWHAVPPLEVLLRTPAARLCAKTKTPLTPEGPFPDKAKRLPEAASSLHAKP